MELQLASVGVGELAKRLLVARTGAGQRRVRVITGSDTSAAAKFIGSIVTERACLIVRRTPIDPTSRRNDDATAEMGARPDRDRVADGRARHARRLDRAQHDPRCTCDASVEQLEWTVNAYNLSFAVLLMTGAALGDRFGRRSLYATGLALFVAALGRVRARARASAG